MKIEVRLAQNLILIYADDGVSTESLEHTKYSLNLALGINYIIKEVTAEHIKEGIEKETCLFVMPGGRATPYRNKLDGLGTDNIKQYVENGGGYLGFGGGAYFGGKEVMFYPDNPDPQIRRIVKDMKLGFFPGAVIGPAYEPYYYDSLEGARAAKIKLTSEFSISSMKIFHNGGGYFDSSSFSPEIDVIAWYDDLTENHPAIVECHFGNGKAILSGVRPEYNLKMLEAQNPGKRHVSSLKRSISNSHSFELFKFLLRKFQLVV